MSLYNVKRLNTLIYQLHAYTRIQKQGIQLTEKAMRCWVEVEASCDVKSQLRLIVNLPALDPHHQLSVGTVWYRYPNRRPGFPDRDPATFKPREDSDVIITSSNLRGAILRDVHTNIHTVSAHIDCPDANITDEIQLWINRADAIEGVDRGADIGDEVEVYSRHSMDLITEGNLVLLERVALTVGGEGEGDDEERISSDCVIYKHIS